MTEAPKRIWIDGIVGRDWAWGQTKEFDDDIEYIRDDLVEAAIKRALDAAADCCKSELRNTAMLTSDPPQSSAAWNAATSIRALDPAQFIEEPKG